MKHKHAHIWYQKPVKFSLPRTSECEDVEDFFSTNFENGYPVLVSSARAAIAVLLNLFWMAGTINVFKYASQCVVNACLISNVSPSTSINLDEDIVYHQWGYPQNKRRNDLFLEDACDSFKPLGSKVLILESRFEVWSLSKILGLRTGAVIWCRNKKDAQELIKFRNSKNISYLKIALNFFKKLNVNFYRRWEFLELTNCSLSKFQIGAIQNEIVNWEDLFNKRQELLKSKINALRQLGYNAGFENEEAILAGTLLPAVLIGTLELENFTRNSLTLNRINVKSAPYLVRILPVWTFFK